MKLETEIRSNPTHIYYKITGVLTLAHLLEAAKDINEISKRESIIYIVADYRDVIFEINMASVFEIPEELESVGMPVDAISAILYKKNAGTSERFEMYKMLARSKGHIVELFTDEQDALKWLSEKQIKEGN